VALALEQHDFLLLDDLVDFFLGLHALEFHVLEFHILDGFRGRLRRHFARRWPLAATSLAAATATPPAVASAVLLGGPAAAAAAAPAATAVVALDGFLGAPPLGVRQGDQRDLHAEHGDDVGEILVLFGQGEGEGLAAAARAAGAADAVDVVLRVGGHV